MCGEREEFADRLIQSMSSGVIAINSQGRVMSLNAAAGRMLNLWGDDSPAPREGWRGCACRGLLSRQPSVVALLEGALEGRNCLSRAELVLEAEGDGPRTTIGFTLSGVRDRAGDLCGAAMIFRDLTPIERGDEQLRLKDRLAALGQMAAGLAHEIRNPLAGMEVLAGLLRRRLGDRPSERELVDQLTGELRAVADTVTESLDFVKSVPPSRAPVDLELLLDGCLESALLHRQSSVALERSFECGLPTVSADADQLRSVVSILIENALEAVEGVMAPRLRLGLARGLPISVGESRTASREVIITVADNGPGVAEEIREKIFYPFFTTKQRGSGVGLAMAQKIVTNHGGMLELDTRVEVGSTFRVHLPDARCDAPGGDGGCF